MNESNLRNELAGIAGQVRSIDLHERALHRSRQIGRHRGAIAVAVAALLVMGVIGWQLLPPVAAHEPVGGVTRTGQPSPTPPAPSAQTPAPTATPEQPSPTRGTGFRNATLVVPAWPPREGPVPCPDGPIPFSDGLYRPGTGVDLTLPELVTGDVGGARTIVAVVQCYGPGEGGPSQIVAYREAAGAYAMLGVVVDSTLPAADAEVGPVSLSGISLSHGVVTVHLILPGVGTAPPAVSPLTQIRTYSWQGAQFVQTGGPTRFVVDPATADLTLAAGDLNFAKDSKGCWIGHLTMTVTNHGPRDAAAVTAVVYDSVATPAPSDPCQPVSGQGYGGSLAAFGVVAAGGSRQVTITVVAAPGTTPPPPVEDHPWFQIELRIGTQRFLATTHFVVRNHV